MSGFAPDPLPGGSLEPPHRLPPTAVGTLSPEPDHFRGATLRRPPLLLRVLRWCFKFAYRAAGRLMRRC